LLSLLVFPHVHFIAGIAKAPSPLLPPPLCQKVMSTHKFQVQSSVMN
ncbi:3547_t:CDS:2, partial [Dentiscutata heterogama]